MGAGRVVGILVAVAICAVVAGGWLALTTVLPPAIAERQIIGVMVGCAAFLSALSAYEWARSTRR